MSIAATIIDVVPGDITTQQVDVIVNPTAQGGGGGQCSKAIRSKWPEAVEGVNMGSKRFQIVAVPGNKLPAKHVMHVNCSRTKEEVSAMLDNSLSALRAHNCKTIAFPIIGSGTAGRDYDTCAQELAELLCTYFVFRRRGDVSFISEVRVIVYDPSRSAGLYERVDRAYKKAAGLDKEITRLGAAAAVPGTSSSSVNVNWSSAARGSSAYQRTVAAVPADLRGMITAVQVCRSSDDAATAALSRLRLQEISETDSDTDTDSTHSGDSMQRAEVVMHQRDAAGNLIGRVGLRKQ